MELLNKFIIIITTIGADLRHEQQENHIEIK